MLTRSEVRQEIIAQGCEKCGESIGDAEDFVLTFCGGRFIVLHEECADFIDHATKGPRKPPDYSS
jgi:hypothetical protein